MILLAARFHEEQWVSGTTFSRRFSEPNCQLQVLKHVNETGLLVAG